MKNIFFRITLIAFLLSFSLHSISQKVWTLEEIIAYAQQNNIQVKKAQLTEELSAQTHLQSKLNLLPSINASTGYYFNFGKTIDPTTNLFVNQNTQTNTLSIDGSIGIFNGFQRWNFIKQSEYDYLASHANTQNTVNTVLLYAVGGFLDVVYGKENLKIAEDQLALSQQQLDRTKKLVESGALTPSAQYDIEAQAARDEVARVNAQNTLEIARLNLTQLLNLTEPIDIAVPQINMSIQLEQLNQTMIDIYDMALTNQPSIHSAEYQLKSAEKGVSISRGALYPSLTGFASLSTNYSNLYKNYGIDNSSLDTFTVGYLSTDLTPVINFSPIYRETDVPLGKQYSDNFGQAFGFSLNIPIFNNWQNRTAVVRSKIQLMDAQFNLESAKQTLLKDVQTAYQDAVASKNSYEAALKAVSSLQKSFEDAQKKFDLGALTSIDFITTQNNYIRAQSELLQAKYQYIFKLKVLDFYQGKPITLQ